MMFIIFLLECALFTIVYLTIDYLFHKKHCVLFRLVDWLKLKISEHDDYKKLTR